MLKEERLKIVRSLACVDSAILAVDEDRTVCKTLKLIHPDIFTNGGDQTNDKILEKGVCCEMGTKLVDGLGNKIQSSSWLIANAAKVKQVDQVE